MAVGAFYRLYIHRLKGGPLALFDEQSLQFLLQPNQADRSEGRLGVASRLWTAWSYGSCASLLRHSPRPAHEAVMNSKVDINSYYSRFAAQSSSSTLVVSKKPCPFSCGFLTFKIVRSIVLLRGLSGSLFLMSAERAEAEYQ
jgi:hypothetical protein